MIQLAIVTAIAFATPASPETSQPAAGTETPVTATEEGFVTAELSINEKGAVDKCTVVETNTPKDFSDKVCGIFVSKFKFEPKRDTQGSAQRYTLTRTIRFVIQN
jgi:hypothetical protein